MNLIQHQPEFNTKISHANSFDINSNALNVNPSADFQSYAEIMKDVKEAVKHKQGGDIFEFSWETEDDEDSQQPEEAVQLKADGNNIKELNSEFIVQDMELPATYSDAIRFQLEDDFNKKHLNSCILVDFQERYIHHYLKKGTGKPATKLELAQLAWKETTNVNQMNILENIGRNLPVASPNAERLRLEETNDFDLDLSQNTKDFSSFIPNQCPKLNLDGISIDGLMVYK